MLSLLKNFQIESPPLVQAAPTRCLRRRLSTCDCRLCLDVCAAGAISLERGQLQLDQQRCTGCMACVAACRNEALVAPFDLEGMLQKVREKAEKQPVVSCIRQKRRSVEELTVPCLGILSEEALLALGRSGCRSIEFNLTACPSCENHQAAARFLSAFQWVTEAAAQVFSAELALSENTPPETAKDGTDRRSFLAEVRAKISIFSPISLDMPDFLYAAQPEKTHSRRLPIRVKIIERIVADVDGESKEQILALCTHRVTAGPACNCCPLCTGICPTGALRVAGSDTEKRLVFTSTRCSGCGLCVLFCRKKAISLSLSPLSGGKSAGTPDRIAWPPRLYPSA